MGEKPPLPSTYPVLAAGGRGQSVEGEAALSWATTSQGMLRGMANEGEQKGAYLIWGWKQLYFSTV